MATKKSPTPLVHKVIALSSARQGDARFREIEDSLDALARDGWSVHITSVDLSMDSLHVYGVATRESLSGASEARTLASGVL